MNTTYKEIDDYLAEVGRYLDPLADKLLVLTAYCCFVFIPDYRIPFWIIIIARFGISGLPVQDDSVLPANMWQFRRIKK